MVAHYIDYYENQIGGGRMHNVFVGAPYQRGHGIGSFLGGLFRSVLPLLSKGAKAIGKEALRAGLHVVEDVSGNNIPFRESLRRRAAESGENLQRKARDKISLLMNGSGYNSALGMRSLHSITGRAPVRVVARKRRSSRKGNNTKKLRRVTKRKKKKIGRKKRGATTRKKRKPSGKKRSASTDIFD